MPPTTMTPTDEEVEMTQTSLFETILSRIVLAGAIVYESVRHPLRHAKVKVRGTHVEIETVRS